jgi:outer membrane beta-barrel protein
LAIRNLAAAFTVALLCSAGSALAQDLGLDLTEEPKKDEPKKEEPEAVTPPASVKTATDVAPTTTKKSDTPAVERDTTQDDRVKSVQKKLYLKRFRFELAPYFIINVNDAYYTKLGGALRAAFYPADSLAISVRFSLMQTLPTDDVRVAKRNLNSRIFFSVPTWAIMGDVEWSPIYGKVAFFNDILHLDGYLVGGGGVVHTETSEAKLPDGVTPRGVSPAFDLGLGFRFVVKDFMAVNVALINTTYVDTPTGTTKGVVQNLMMVNAGISIFIPFKSTYRDE